MFKTIYENYKNFEKITLKILKNGLNFCFLLSLISISLFITYDFAFKSLELYYIGLALFRISLFFAVDFIICAFITDGLKKHLI